MRLPQPLDAHEVRHHESVEAPLAAQDVGKRTAVARARDAVDRVVGRHHRTGSRIDRGTERRQVGLAQLALAHEVRTSVLPALRGTVGDEVLERRERMARLREVGRPRAAHERLAHARHEEAILAVALLDARPAGVAHDVEHRTVADVGALRPDLGRHGASQALDERRVPCRGLPDRRGEHRGADGHMAVGRLLGEEQGNAQPRMLRDVALHLVGQPRRKAGRESRPQVLARPRVGAERPPQHADVAFVHRPAERIGQHQRIARTFVHFPPVGRLQLPDLLVERHLGRQQLRTPGRRQRSVAPVAAARRERHRRQ